MAIMVSTTFSGCKKKVKEIIIVPDAQKTHLQRSRLKGEVKTITTTTYYSHSKDSLTDDKISSIVIHHYSSDGLLLKMITLDKKMDTVSVREVFYHSNGKEDKWVEYENLFKRTLKCQYNYDMNGFISGEDYFSQDTLKYSVLYKTDGLGGATEMIRKYPDYSIKNTFIYNEKGLIIKINEFDPEQKLFKFIIIEYDNYGDEVNRKVYRGDNNMIEYTFTQYDTYGKLIKVLFENRIHGLKDIKTYFDHDHKGNWNFEIFTSNSDTIYFRKREINYY
jgi:hypothetical protein